MNREILFKAKRLYNGEWVEGYLFDDGMPKPKRYFIGGIIVKPYEGTACDKWNIVGIDFFEIDIDTLCQYTGLTDKNGQKIWENDICDRKEKYPEIATYNKGDWQLDYSYVFGKEMHTDACNLGFYVCERNCVEVIGNIFDNPELLEVE
jgi:uncharacterized phage protein (TIGR01671 family)